MKPYIVPLLFSLLPQLSAAQQEITLPPADQTPTQQQLEPDNSRSPANQWCVYADRRYTRGSVITIGGQEYLCIEEVDENSGQPRLVWRSAG